ncbi:MAG TPA: cation diffusion facilitator family transporter [Nitrospirota bacterium]|nr:cation diffusion facilitator family transporter [Nitrospirota bacterium]
MKILAGLKTDTEQSRSLMFSIALTGFIFIVEVVGGFMTNSLALLSDAAHVLADLVALGLALFAIMLSGLPSSDTRTYGWHRSEVFAALINGATLIVISGVILYEAVLRIMDPEPVKSVGMLVVAAFGLVINILVVHRLRGHDHHDINMRSAFLHVLGDALISVGVIAGAAVMYFTGWYMVDPALSIVFSFVILRGALKVLYEAAHILLEGVPKGLNIQDVVEEIKKVEHVVDVHRMHVWSICSSISALSAHILIEKDYSGDRSKIINDINCKLVSCFHINHTTLQLEKGACEFNNLVCDVTHCDRRRTHAHAHHEHSHADTVHAHSH